MRAQHDPPSRPLRRVAREAANQFKVHPAQWSPALLVRLSWTVGAVGDRCLLLTSTSDIVGHLHAHEGVHLHAEGLFNP